MFGRGSNERRGTRRRLLAAGYVVTLVAASVISTGVTYGLLSVITPQQSHAFTAGTVTLARGASGSCNVAKLMPTGVASTCTLQATYTGTASTYLALDVLIQTQAGSGGTKLYNPGGAGGLQVTISSTTPSVASYSVPAASTACPAGAPAASTCYRLDRELVSTTPLTSASAPVTFTTTVSIPASSPTGYQGGQAQVVLTAHSVQTANNGAVAGCTPGLPCNAVSWS